MPDFQQLPHASMALIVAKAFVEENDEATEFYKMMKKYQATPELEL